MCEMAWFRQLSHAGLLARESLSALQSSFEQSAKTGVIGVQSLPLLPKGDCARVCTAVKEIAMQRRHEIELATLVIWVALAFVFVLAGSPDLIAQSLDPLVGTWNMSGSSNGNSPFISVEIFSPGGTTVEYDTSGTNSSASPGESIGLGSWQKTSKLHYLLETEAYLYDSSGKLSSIVIAKANMTLSPSLKHLHGAGKLKFYNCSLSLCPGSLMFTLPVQFTGRRF